MTAPALRRVALGSYVALIALSLLWEAWLAPSRSAMAFWLVVKLLPLLLPLPGMLSDRLRAYVFACLIVLLYIIEATVLTYTQAARPLVITEPRLLAWIELLLVCAYFVSATFYVRRRRAEISRSQAPAETGS